MKNKKPKFEKPNTKDLKEIIAEEIPVEIAQNILIQIEELCLIIIDHNENE